MRCAAITRGGERCKLDATTGSFCWSHAPENAESRRRRARRGGKAGGRGRGSAEVSDLKQRLSAVVDGVLDGTVDRGRAAVAVQGLSALRGVLDLERKIKEADELEDRISALERLDAERRTG